MVSLRECRYLFESQQRLQRPSYLSVFKAVLDLSHHINQTVAILTKVSCTEPRYKVTPEVKMLTPNGQISSHASQHGKKDPYNYHWLYVWVKSNTRSEKSLSKFNTSFISHLHKYIQRYKVFSQKIKLSVVFQIISFWFLIILFHNPWKMKESLKDCVKLWRKS